MEKMLSELILQAPSTVAVILVVVVFVRYIGKRDDLWTELHREHLEARRVSSEGLKANTEALAKNTSAFIQMTQRLEGIDYFCPVAHEMGGVHIPKRSQSQHPSRREAS